MQYADPCVRASQCRILTFWRDLVEAIRQYANRCSVADLIWNRRAVLDYVI